MNSRELSEKIFNELNLKGAGLGNASIGIIEQILLTEMEKEKKLHRHPGIENIRKDQYGNFEIRK